MIVVRHSTQVSHYLKIVGDHDSIPVTSGDVRNAFQALLAKKIPDTRLTFAMKLSQNHHCTICFVDQNFSDDMIDCIEKYLKNWKKKQFDIVAKKVSRFGNKRVIILEFTSEDYNKLFQETSQKGTTEGNSVIRTPHLTFYNDEKGKNKQFIDNILLQLRQRFYNYKNI
jgi:2'-5' RNA ligase